MPEESKETFHLPCTDPQFLLRISLHLIQEMAEHPLVQFFDLRTEARLSYLFDLSAIQESFRFRALRRARRIAIALVDEKGQIKKDFLKSFTDLYEKTGAIFYPEGQNDSFIHGHILHFLKRLSEESIVRSLQRFQSPLCHKWAERLVLETLGIYATSVPTDSQVKAAVLCACLTPLRQNVGSCFATAPAILVQKEQVELMIDDLYQLLSTGKLKRTFGGIEYAIPLSPSTGAGDLKKNLISSDAKAKSSFCPGLIWAMESIQALPSDAPIEEQEGKLQALIQTYSAGKNHFTSDDLIRHVLMERLSLSEEDLEKAHSMEIAQFKNSQMAFRGPDANIARKLEQIQSYKQKEKEAKAIFKGVCDNALLKAWEFTLASFSEVKMEFSRWNLYSSLGLAPEEPGGIGEVIYKTLDEKIKELNLKIEEYQKQYEIAFDQLRATETLLRNAASESDARRLQAEHQSRAYHMRSCLELRDKVYARGSHYSTLFSFLVRQYDLKFPEYFQEIFDAEMQDLKGDFYDDSPAGFRLVYKHGRSDPSLWTLIYNADQYIDALLDFFKATESQIAAACEWEGGEDEILELTSAIIVHIRSSAFLESALQRMAKAHDTPIVKSPLKNLPALEKKPWAYVSGGTIITLLKTYFCRESELTTEGKWVESESELLIFILDTLKNLPPKISNPFLKNPEKGMLMTSPSHAFVLLPGQERFCQGWQEEIFTYTYVRDEIFLPSQRFYAEMRLNSAEQSFLLNAFCEQLPPQIGHYLNQVISPMDKKISIVDWRNKVLETLCQHTKANPLQKQALSNGLDAYLYQVLPLTSGKEWKVLVRRILSDRMDDKVENVLRLFPDAPCPFMTAAEIREAAKGCYLLAEKSIALSFDLHQYLAHHSRFVGNAQPTSLLFADTNWTNYFFGFVVNPGTMRLELWRLDRTLSRGVPMSQWKHWLNGIDRKSWSIFTHPFEYVMGLKLS